MKRWPLLREYFSARRTRSWSRKELLERQEHEVQKFLGWAITHSPYTRQRMEGLSRSQWRSLPVMDKADMMENFDALNTVGLRLSEALAVARTDERQRSFKARIGNVSVGLSSGTSGQLGLFAVSEIEQQQWAGRILAKVLPDHLLFPTRDRVAFFLRANNALYESAGSLRLRFEFFDLAREIPRHLSRLESLQPTILVAPPSALRSLEDAVSKGHLRLTPKRIVSVAEPLEELDRKSFERTFLGPIHQVYQATEGFLGATCELGVMHLNEDTLVIERDPLGDGRFVPIVTDFRRTTQPIIRYRLDDVLRLRQAPCPCGSPLVAIDAIEGRLGDILTGQRRSGGRRKIYADLVRRSILTAATNIRDYGVRQQKDGTLGLYLRPEGEDIRKAVTQSLHQLYWNLGCETPAIQRIDSWPQGGLRKRKRIEVVQ